MEFEWHYRKNNDMSSWHMVAFQADDENAARKAIDDFVAAGKKLNLVFQEERLVPRSSGMMA